MRVAVIGATGGVGQQIIKHALLQNHEVVALVRNVEKCLQQHEDVKDKEGLSVKKVNIFDTDSLSNELQASDAVFCALGPTGLWNCTTMTDSIPALVKAMQKSGVKRLVYCSTWGAESRPGNPFFLEWVVKPLFIGSACKDHRRAELHIENEAGIEYTIVRPPHLVNTPWGGQDLQIETGGMWAPGCIRGGIPRSEVAKFMLKCVTEGIHIREDVAIGLKEPTL